MTMATGPASWRVGVDVGGTFTDLVVASDELGVRVFKVPSVPADPAAGVLAALERAASGLGMVLEEFLRSCALLVHGSTVATNTVLELKGARVGLLTTAGFRDSLEIRRGRRSNPWHHREPSPLPLVPRYLRQPVRGRIDREGNEVEPLHAADVESAARLFTEEGVNSVAICFMNSYLEGAHERAAAAALGKHWTGRWISVSSDIAPLMGEYERTSTTVVNAYVAPGTVGYLQTLDRRLRDLGFAHSILLIQNNGGAVSVEQVADRPVTLLLSGPAAGVGALEYYRRAIGSGDLISMEIGGTSCDVIVMSDGTVPVTDDLTIGDHHLSIPSVEVHTVGAGGGTLAGVDGAGMLFVGPRGAGARPGPAAYGLGGREPTVTDAQLVLGRLRPGPYADGSVSLDPDLAAEAITKSVAEPLGVDLDAAAAGIVRLLEQHLLHAVQRLSIERGLDPRRFVLVAAGGAGPMHGAAIGRLLGCRRVYVPRVAGAFCALGMLHSNVRHDYVQTWAGHLEAASVEHLDVAYLGLEERARRALAAAGFAPGARLEREVDLRYLGQQWDVRVRLDGPSKPDPERMRAVFELEYDRLFGHHQPGGIVEITKLRVVGIGTLPALRPRDAMRAAAPAQPIERRSVYLDAARGRVLLGVYRGGDLRPGHRLSGPLLVEEDTTTMLVGAVDVLEVDDASNFVIELLAEA